MKNIYRILVSLLFLGVSLPAFASVNAWLSQGQVGSGDSVQLTLEHDGQTDSQPDLGPLRQNFDILGRSSASSIQIINGKMASKMQLTLTLAPKRTGKLLVPPLQWDGESTPALTLSVGGNAGQGGGGQAGNGQAANNAHVFITASLSQPHPYVEAATILSVRLYADEPLYNASLELPSGNDVLVQQLGKDRQSSETRNGRNYQVVERRYLLFPQRSGKIRLDGPVLNAQVQDSRSPFGQDPFFGNMFGQAPFSGMLNSSRPIRVLGDPVTLDVRPRPASASGRDWLPARSLTLQESWQPDGGSIRAGAPLTRHLHISAQGMAASQLPDLSKLMPLPDGVRAYPDQPKLRNSVQGDTIVGTQDQDIALIANRPGRYEIPAMHLYWWDTAGNVQREVSLPARTLNVLPDTPGVAVGTTPSGGSPADSIRPAPPPQVQVTTQPKQQAPAMRYHWDWVSAVLAMLWLGTLVAWWHSSRHKQAPADHVQPVPASASGPRMGELREAFRQACRENNPRHARRHLLAWARANWPQDPPMGLRALVERMDDPALETLLSELDRACYTDGAWHGSALMDAIRKLPGRRKPAMQPTPELAGLYP